MGEQLVSECRDLLSLVLPLRADEREFIECLNDRGEIAPELLTGDRAMQAFKGLELDSPRGRIRIDPETRDVIQTVYVRKVEKKEDGYYNVEFEQFPEQKDPGK